MKFESGYLKKVVIVIISLLLLDFLWIGFINNKMYLDMYKDVQCNQDVKVDIVNVIICYLLICGLLIFFVIPNIKGKEKTMINAFMYSGLLGFFVYGIYNFTNLSLLKSYSLKVGIIDTLWGTALFTILGRIMLEL